MHKMLFTLICICSLSFGQSGPQVILEDLQFPEGPAVNAEGVLFFSDIPPRLVYRYAAEELTVFLDSTGGANGLAFDAQDRLVACAGKARHVFRLEPDGSRTILADSYNGKKLNSPNDLWIDPHGGIYFTDPRYGSTDDLEQDGMHVYYLQPGAKKLIRVIDHLTRPNGIIGTPDNQTLYVVDEGERQTWQYRIGKNGKVTDKTLFCNGGIDGLALTDKGGLVVTMENAVRLFTPAGEQLKSWPFENNPTNVCFAEGLLYVTTQGGRVYHIHLGQ